ncbi:MAG: HAD family hydrolase [Bacilli bacterium]|nr:HAD family hydrolase [Bacilli bacterium]
MSKVLAVDLDGTLFYPKHVKRCIPKKNVAFLRKWIDEGNRLVIITSRSHEFTERLKEEIQRDYDVINCTSSQIYHGEELIYEKSMPNKSLEKILKQIEKKYKPIAMFITSKNQPCVIKNTNPVGKAMMLIYRLWYFFQFKYREPSLVSAEAFDEEVKNGEIFKVMIFFGLGKSKGVLSKEINKELREKYPEIESSWSMIVNELTPKDCNKGAGLERYCRLLNIESKDVYVVGDSGNDITMFNRYHENSYCMSHAYPSVKKYAQHVISRVYKLDKLVLKGEK